jgi:hypothetical protein
MKIDLTIHLFFVILKLLKNFILWGYGGIGRRYGLKILSLFKETEKVKAFKLRETKKKLAILSQIDRLEKKE